MFPVGLVIMLTPYSERYLWTTSVFLGLQALILLIFVIKIFGFTKAIIPSFVIFILSFFIEYAGVNTGWPFGDYIYTSVLLPQIAGVPIAIAFAWFSVMISAYLIIIDLFPKTAVLTAALISSVLVFSTDILLEPFASFINGFWLWSEGKIPFINFISWLVLGFLFSLILAVFLKPAAVQETKPFLKKIPYIVFMINMVTFLIINIFHNYIYLSVVGGTIITFIILILPAISKNET